VSTRTKPCDEATTAGRLRKAEQFLEAAETIRDFADDELGDAYVTLCVHASVAAADVICCVELKVHAQGEDHNQALTLLRKIRPDGGLHRPIAHHWLRLHRVGLGLREGVRASASSRLNAAATGSALCVAVPGRLHSRSIRAEARTQLAAEAGPPQACEL
jgi:hypothetical protein